MDLNWHKTLSWETAQIGMTLDATTNLYEQAFRERVNFCDRHGCIFIHIPKAAGTSIAQLLGLPASSHLTYRELLQTEFFRKRPLTPVFTVVRNPISRFVSLFNYARMAVSLYHNNIEPDKGLYGPHTDFRLLSSASLDEAVDHLVAGRLQHDRRWNQWQPQSAWILAEEGHHNPKLTILKLEELETGLRQLLNIDTSNLPHANRSNPATPEPALSAAATSKLLTYYQQDYELLDYRSPEPEEGFSKRLSG